MRKLVLQELPTDIQREIRRKAWREDLTYEKAIIELIRDLAIERAVQHDIAIMERHWDREEDPF